MHRRAVSLRVTLIALARRHVTAIGHVFRTMQLHSDGGQIAIALVPVLMLFAAFGALAVDVGLLVNAKRDAQGDVDRAALAGASALTLRPDQVVVDTSRARESAMRWAENNGLDTSTPDFAIDVVSDCYSQDDGVPTGVRVSASRAVPSHFLSLFGVTDWSTGAVATACAGRPQRMTGFLPYAVAEVGPCFEPDGLGGYRPRVGQLCDMVVDTSSTGLSGELSAAHSEDCDAGDPSSAVLRENVEHGVQVLCRIGESIQGNPGYSVGPNRAGLNARLARDGSCDAQYPGTSGDFAAANAALNAEVAVQLHAPARGDGADDFYETWRFDPSAAHPAAALEPYDCDPSEPGTQTSPRNVTVVIVHDWAQPDGDAGPTSYVVRGFAGMYLEGCTPRNGVFQKDCNVRGGPFTIHARMVERIDTLSDLGALGAGDIGVFLAR